ncbi:MAG TPA: sigma-54 dependent transcriptional regulator [Ktedonobacterales bacterium]|jgi:two-component system response regulator AtoC
MQTDERVPPDQRGAENATILIGDDEPSTLEILRETLGDDGYTVITASTGNEALRLLTEGETRPDIALLDIRMPDLQGTEILQRMLQQGIDLPVILMTKEPSASLTIKAMQLGAADYVSKPEDLGAADTIQAPYDLDEVRLTVQRVIRHERMRREIKLVELPTSDPKERMVGTDPRMLDIYKTIGQVARTPATVLVTGETGTGKELMAEAIHNASRRSGALVKVNCAALPETLLESELFGHEKGSFTSAIAQHKGRFETADKGTIFLDEIGEMSLGTQKKMLRVLQEHEFERVGGNESIKVDVRVVAATNKVLREEVLAGRFRDDLFFRLNVIAIHMPPLRERKDDIPALVSHFLNNFRYTPTSAAARIGEGAMAKLQEHPWPGNVRELENIIQRAVVLSRGGLITEDQIVFQNELTRFVLDVEQKVRAGASLDDMLADVRREALQAALRLNGYDHAKAAAQLGMTLKAFDAALGEIEGAA